MFSRVLLALPLLGAALAQQQVSYTDASGIPLTGIYDSNVDLTLGFIFPTSTTGSEFIGELIVPVANKWAGISLGGGMPNNPLVMAWPNDNSIVTSTRFATSYVYPTYYSGPVITTLPYTTINSTHWRWVFRCQNCVAWSNSEGGGSLTQDGSGPIGYVLSQQPVDTPSNPNSTFNEHSYDSITGLDLSGAHNANYQKYLGSSTTTTTITTTTKSTTSTKPTTTTTKTTTTTTTTSSTKPTGTCSALYGQCGGTSWTGATCCASGTCKYSSPYYSQCMN